MTRYIHTIQAGEPDDNADRLLLISEDTPEQFRALVADVYGRLGPQATLADFQFELAERGGVDGCDADLDFGGTVKLEEFEFDSTATLIDHDHPNTADCVLGNFGLWRCGVTDSC